MKYLCPKCDQLMTDMGIGFGILNYKICHKCELVYDYGLFSFYNWSWDGSPIINGDFEFCYKAYKMKVFI